MKNKAVQKASKFSQDVEELLKLILLQEEAVLSGSDKAPQFISHLGNVAKSLYLQWYIGALAPVKQDPSQLELDDRFYRPAKQAKH